MAKQNLYNFLGTYNKAYKTKTIEKKDFTSFLNNLKDFFIQTGSINSENEELLKDKFKECVLKNYQVFANENRIDLSIKKDGKTQVILEFKQPSNKNEMLQIESNNINKKALQEAIWYFYNQDSKEISYQIKNILITDTQHFFFFNPKQFCNKDLEKICLAFRNNQLAYTDTKTLYEQIGAKILEKGIKFDYAEFDLLKYKSKILNNSLNDNELRQLKYFYKALHSDFLLREYSPKDSNELNSNFYNELLYILGLREEGKNQKKIVPSEIKGTLRDNIVDTFSTSNFDDIINLIIIWLNRILFLKLFESQLISFNNNDNKFEFLNYDKISDFAKLNRLFFNILGKPLSERDYKNIPYLNSSLFEKTTLEDKYGTIANLDSDTTIPLFKGSILSKIKNYPKKPTLLKYLLNFLGAYSFNATISENSNNQEIINSSVLGLIFEKLNGYKDGSFFTPAYITEYMAENSINNAILQKYKEYKPDELCNSIEDLKDIINRDNNFKSREERRLFYSNLLIDNLKICDPAVGSGHFLVSVLNYLVALKSELNLLEISNKIEVQNDSLIVYEQDGETQFQYKRNDINSLKIQKTIFDEKRKIIENCLFGVDINPNSVEICCLRLWIELLKNTYYIDNTDEMQILPNIDINIKCGNSLINSYKVRVGHCAVEDVDKRTSLGKEIKAYKELVTQYKNIDNKISKRELKNKIKVIKEKLFPEVQLNLFEDKTGKGIFKDSMEWMIEFPELLDEDGNFKGFDIIIANPPYMRIQKVKATQPKEKEFYENDNYLTAKGSYELANLFIELGIRLSNKNTKCIFIFPHKFLNTDSGEYLREYLLSNNYVDKITHFGANMVFSSADTYTCILEYSKQNNDGILFRKFPFKSDFINLIRDNNLFEFLSYSLIKQASSLYGSNQWILFNNEKEFNIFEKINKTSKRLGDIFQDVFQGIATSNDKLYFLTKIAEDESSYTLELLLNNKIYKVEKDLFKPILKGEDVHKYSNLNTNRYVFFPYLLNKEKAEVVMPEKMKNKYPLTYNYIMDNELSFKEREHHKAEQLKCWYAYIYPKNLNKFEQIKLSSMEICSYYPNVTLNNKNLYHNTKVYSFVKNETIKDSYEYLLAILNSNVLWWFLKNTGDTLQNDARTMKTEYLKPFPIPDVDKEIDFTIQNLVKKLLLEKEQEEINENICKSYENQINKLIYDLYQLTDDEIAVIEKSIFN